MPNKTRQQLIDKLEAMKGQHWLYQTHQHRIIKWFIDDKQGLVTIISDNNGWWQWDFEKALAELNTFLPVGDEITSVPEENKEHEDQPDDQEASLPATLPPNTLSTVQHIDGKMNGVLDTLFENIEKVKQDPKYIPQAQAICKTVNAVVQVVRADLDVARFMNQVDGRRKKR